MEHKTIYAGLGKTLIRKSDGFDRGPKIMLGFEYYIGGTKLEKPLWELEEHYDRVEVPKQDLRLSMVFYSEDEGIPYTITQFDSDGNPIYEEGELEVEIPEGYWESFEVQQVEDTTDLESKVEVINGVEVRYNTKFYRPLKNGTTWVVSGESMKFTDEQYELFQKGWAFPFSTDTESDLPTQKDAFENCRKLVDGLNFGTTK